MSAMRGVLDGSRWWASMPDEDGIPALRAVRVVVEGVEEGSREGEAERESGRAGR